MDVGGTRTPAMNGARDEWIAGRFRVISFGGNGPTAARTVPRLSTSRTDAGCPLSV